MIQPWLYTTNNVAPAVVNASQTPEIAALQQQLQAGTAVPTATTQQPASETPAAPSFPASALAPETLSVTGQATLEQRIDTRMPRFGLTTTFSPLPTATPAPSSAPSTTPLAVVAAGMPTSALPAAASPTEATELMVLQGELNAAEQQIDTLQREIAPRPASLPPVEPSVATGAAQPWQAYQAGNPTFNTPQQGGSEAGDGGEWTFWSESLPPDSGHSSAAAGKARIRLTWGEK
jgi:hypothetical protein